MRQAVFLLVLTLLAGGASASPATAPSSAPISAEDEACIAAVEAARVQAAFLPAGDPSRRFAESDLTTALTEMYSGEVEECPELVERAVHTIETRPYQLRPGEVMRGYGPRDE